MIHVADVRLCMTCGKVPAANDRGEYTPARAMLIVLVNGFCVCEVANSRAASLDLNTGRIQDLGTAVVSVTLPSRKVPEPDILRPAAKPIEKTRLRPEPYVPVDQRPRPMVHAAVARPASDIATQAFPAPSLNGDRPLVSSRTPALAALMTGGTDPRGIPVLPVDMRVSGPVEHAEPASDLTPADPLTDPLPIRQPVPETAQHVPPAEVTDVMDAVPPQEQAEEPAPPTAVIPAQPAASTSSRSRKRHPHRQRRSGR